MTIKAVRFVGMRTDKLQEHTALFRDLLGLEPVREEPQLTEFRLGDGTRFELYGPEDTFHAFFRTGPVVGFEVPDFDATKQKMQAAGFAFIGESQHEAGISWQHFHLPDGTVVEIIGRGRPT
ncbi:VOC family protein [Devosia nitrariae]|uniref:VOC domain-containing protein n=1 Tax=Devosia nitrariae TaxID=2071872 RepID=A0ABQ5WAE7_9HYPH|nr:VOC family protein [Devosia nitrariae]GLQ57080.1 hypothetical protein GCM10010862_43390 [Devosia nitrariae]